MCGHYLFAKAYNDLFHVINGNEVGFVWQFPWNILIWYLFLKVSVLCFVSMNAVATSFQNIESCSPLDLSN